METVSNCGREVSVARGRFAVGRRSNAKSVIKSARIVKSLTIVVICALFLGLATAPAEMDLETNRVQQNAAQLLSKPAGFGRPISDRGAWARLAQTPAFASVVPQAKKQSLKPVPALPDDLRAKILAEALTVWDREYNIPQLAQKLEAFVKRYPGRLS